MIDRLHAPRTHLAGITTPLRNRLFPAEILEARIAPAAFSWNSVLGGAWEDSSKWQITSGTDADGVPDSDDTVIINPLTEVTVSISSAQSAKSISIPGDDHLLLTAGSLTITDASTINTLEVSNARVTAFAQLTLTGSSSVLGIESYLTGSFRNEGTLTINPGSGSAAHLDSGLLSNAGTINHLTGRLDFNGVSPALANLPGAFYQVKTPGDAPFVGNSSASEVFANAGTLRRDGTGVARFDNVTFSNTDTGIIDVVTGTLQVNAFGSMDGGNFKVASGALLNLGGITQSWNGMFTGSGAGTVNFNYGTISTTGTGAILNFPANFFVWSDEGYFLSATVVNSGAITIAPTGAGSAHLNASVLSNSGTITQTSGRLDFNGNNSQLQNLAGATYEVKIAGDGAFVGNLSSTEVFDNAGTLRRDGAGVARFDNVTFHNAATGIIEVTTGTLQINADGSMDGGNFKVSAGALVNLGGINQTWNGTFTGTGSGTVSLNNGRIGTTGGSATLNFPPNLFVWADEGYFSSATVSNIGSLTISVNTGTTAHLENSTLSNSGTITHLSGRLDFNGAGSQLQNLAGGTYDVKIAGDGAFVGNQSGSEVFDNAGTLRRDGTGVARFDNVNFHNAPSGIIDVVTGTLQINAEGAMDGATFKVASGAFLNLGGINQAWAGTFTGSGLGTINFNNGRIVTGGGTATLNFPANQFVWADEGYFTGATVNNIGSLTISVSTGTTAHLEGSTLSNSGTITHLAGRVDFNGNGSQLKNLAGALYEVKQTGDGAFLGNSSGSETFDNAGTLKRNGTGVARFDNTNFHNAATGIIDVVAGTLQINAEGSMDGGNFNVAAGSFLNLGGINQSWKGTFTGSGSGTVTFNNGTITTSGTGATLNFPAGLFVWADEGYFTGATLSNTGVITISVNPGTVAHLSSSVLSNAGTITHLTGRLDFNGIGSQLQNLAGALYEVKQTGDGPFLGNSSGSETFDNAGTLKRNGTGAARFDNTNFHNAATGIIEVAAGTLQINAEGSMDGGSFNVAAGAFLNLGGINQSWNGTFTGAGPGTISFNYGTITTTSAGATLNFPAGVFTWGDEGYFTGATLNNIGSLTISVNPGTIAHLNSSILSNAGTITHLTGRLDFNGIGSQLQNLAGALYEVKQAGDGPFLGNASGSEVFDNAGTLKRNGSGVARFDNTNFHNAATGIIEVAAGTLQINAEGSMDGGNFNVAAGAFLNLGGINQSWKGNFTGSGPGTISLNYGTITTPSAGATLNFPAGVFVWSDEGYFTGATLSNIGSLTISVSPGTVAHLSSSVLSNSGTITHLSGRLDFNNNGSQLRNLAGGLYEVKQTGDGAFLGNASGSELFDNAGTLRRDGTGNARIDGVDFSSTGVIEVVNGTLQLNGPVAQISGTKLNAGTWKVGAGATLIFPTSITENAGNLEIGGTFDALSTLTKNDGSISFTDGVDFATSGALTNNGTISVGPASNFTVSGALVLGTSSTLEFLIGGTPASGNFGLMTVTGAATLAGKARFATANGYGTSAGQSFTLMTFPSATGSFSGFEGIYDSGRAKTFDPVVSPVDLKLNALVDAADLDVTNVTFTGSNLAGQNITVNYSVSNNKSAATFTNTWVDSIYLSTDDTYDSNDKLIGRVTHTGVVAGNGSYNGSLTAPLPGSIPANYRILVLVDSRGLVPDSDRTNNSEVSATALSTDITALTSGVSSNGTISSGQDVWYRIDAPFGQTLSFTGNFGTPGSVEVTVRQFDTPTATTYDQYAFGLSHTSESFTQFASQDGTYYVRLHGRESAGVGTSYSFTATALPFGIVSVETNHGSNLGSVTTVVHGSLFSPSTQFSLVPASGPEVPASNVIFKDPGTAWVTFNLQGLSIGDYGVHAKDGAAQDTEASAFHVNHGRAGEFSYNLIVPNYIRPPFRGVSAVFEYENFGETDIIAPLISIVNDNAKFRFSTSDGFINDYVQILAINPDGPAGTLSPGTHGRIEVFFEPKVVGAHLLSRFETFVDTSAKQTVDWSKQKEDLRPEQTTKDAWDAIFSNFTSAVGNNMASFSAKMAANATHLSLLNQATYRVDSLMGYELLKAGDFGKIASRFTPSIFGRGNATGIEEHIFIDSDKNVAVQTGSQYRGFVKLSNGTYRGLAGETGKLELLNGGLFLLTDYDGTKTRFLPNGKLDYVEAANGNRLTSGYNGSGQLVTLTSSNGDVQTFTYNAAGLVSESTDAVGRKTTYTYNAAGDLLTTTDSSGTMTFAYSPDATGPKAHTVTSTTYTDGTHSFYTYDSRGRLVHTEQDGGYLAVNYSYVDSDEYSSTDAAGTTRYFYDSNGNLARVVDATGKVTTNQYSSTGRLLGATGVNGAVLKTAFDANGQISGTTDPLGGKTSYKLGSTSHRLDSLTDALGRVTSYQYDSDGNLATEILPDGSKIVRTYDSRGHLLSTTDQSGSITSLTYDSHDLITRKDLPDGSRIDYTYDGHRNLLTATLTVGNTTQVTSYEYNARDQVTKVTFPTGKFIQYTYDSAGRKLTVADQSGFTEKYSYDSHGRLASVKDTNDAVIVSYTYDAFGRVQQEARGAGDSTTTYSYDALGRTTSIVHKRADNSVIDSFNYTYGNDGRIATAQTSAGAVTYTYDRAGQLTSAHLANGTQINYTYDAVGNRTSVSTNGNPESYLKNSSDEYLSAGSETFHYDANGNLISRTGANGTTLYKYDAQNRLTDIISPSETIHYSFDALGNKIAETVNGVRTEFVPDIIGSQNLFGEYNAGGQVVAHYASGLGLTAKVSAGGAFSFYHADVSGNIVDISGAAGVVLNSYTYEPFGSKVIANETTANRFTFSGQFGVQDAGDGLYQTRNRVYDSDLGRFLQTDPLRTAAGSTNLYRYASNSPVQNGDPSGLEEFTTYVGVGGEVYTPIAGGNLAAGLAIQSTDGDSWLGSLGSALIDSGPYISYGTGKGLGAGVSAQVGGSSSFEGQSLSIGSGYGPVGFSGTLDPNTGAVTGAGGSLGLKLKIPTPKHALGNENLTTTHKLSLRNVGKFVGKVTGLYPDPNDALTQPGGLNDPDWGSRSFIRLHNQTMQDELDRNHAHRPPTPDEIHDAARNIADRARMDDYIRRFDDWLQHDGRPETEPRPPVPRNPHPETITPGDPNNILAPRGGKADALAENPLIQPVRFDGYIGTNDTYGFTILFENKPDASAPAQVVKITQKLDSDLDLSTFQFGSFGWGDTKETSPAGRTSFHSQVDATKTLGILVNIDADLNTITGDLTVTFTSIDPKTGDIPLDPFAGFLPPNTTAPIGDGFVTYSVHPKAGLLTGADIKSQATIVFDTEAPLDTPEVHNTIDALAPVSSITAFPGATSQRPSFKLSWSGSDEVNGSGIAGYNVFVIDNGGTPQLIAAATTNLSMKFTGQVGHTYGFFTQAVDGAGNLEAAPVNPDATIQVIAPNFVNVGKKHDFTDSDGDVYTVTFTGKNGSAKVALLDPDGDGKGPIDIIQLDSTDQNSGVTITVKRKGDGPDADKLPDGDGVVTIGDVIVNGGLGSFTAKASDLIVNGFTATGPVKSVTIRDVLQPDAILATPAITVGGTNVDKLALSARNIVDNTVITTPGIFSSITAAAIGAADISGVSLSKLSITAGSIAADLNFTGAVGPVTVKNGSVLPSTWTASTFGAISVTSKLPGAQLAAAITTTGAVGNITVKNGSLVGDITASSVGAISITGGSDSGSIFSTTPAATLDKTAAVKSLSIVGGDFTGSIYVLGSIGKVSVSKDAKGTGGSISGSNILAANIAAITTTKNLANSTILAGADLGIDRALGGLGDAADTFKAGSIGMVKVGGDAIAAIIAAGLTPGNTTIGDGDDAILGGATSSIGAFSVTGTSTSSYFAAGVFKAKPKIHNAIVTPTAITGGFKLP